jgi:hypothetical protein
MIAKLLSTILLFLLPSVSLADRAVFWPGGLWNLDYPGDTSTYGYFRLTAERDVMFKDGYILRVEWLERINGNGDRLYGSLLVPEQSSYLGDGKMKAEMGEVPSLVRLQNSKNQVEWLRLWEPTRYAIQKTPGVAP